ncbi:transcription termination factor Rho [Ornithinimicrobium pratense]|uniref:Transcription termination factor Rho n=1 Tax=Ornithinimicrobium pratense TaxID=2593973 RepID=A0A5J6V1W3_9MICO|nr:transcription termination factor Rho [Ornithinimicrobium pratense]QFG67819.1 transcription termination factor Rho [Ornithinimicrobium pratense]
MTETTDAVPTRTGSLSTLRLAELQQLASSMGITVNAKMRKADLVSAIRAGGGAGPAGRSAAAQEREQGGDQREQRATGRQEQRDQSREHSPDEIQAAPAQEAGSGASTTGQDPADSLEAALDRAQAQRDGSQGGSRTRRSRRAGSSAGAPRAVESPVQDREAQQGQQDHIQRNREAAADREAQQGQQDHIQRNREAAPDREARQGQQDHAQRNREAAADREAQQGQQDRTQRNREAAPDREAQQGQQREQQGQRGQQSRDGEQAGEGQQQGQQQRDDLDGDDDGRRGRRRNRNRNRDRKRGRVQGGPDGPAGPSGQQEEQEGYTEEDVLVPVGGILDLLDNYAFIRTTGYLPGPTDVYVPMGMVKRHGLRKGDAIQGAIKAPQDGSDVGQHTVSSTGNKRDRGKFSALVRLDKVNGQEPDGARRRPDFASLTPLYPQQRLRLETEQKNLTTRVIDLVAPIGKGQRGLIVSPPKAGKTMVLQAIANAITTNNPEVHLMIVLVDERPEEVTDFQRSVKGEVISSTFDRPASDHTLVSELAIERAKRLVELGQDVVVLLDGITRLGRAYNLAAPASGRILSGGVDSAALYPPKKFFGAARNIENGGSLTILATALVETGSKMDEVIFEEFKGTGNMELRLSRQLADRRTFPAVDVNGSGTRREEILMGGDELKIMWKLRRVLSALDQQQGIELLIDRLKKTKHNYEFLTQVQQTSSTRLDDED